MLYNSKHIVLKFILITINTPKVTDLGNMSHEMIHIFLGCRAIVCRNRDNGTCQYDILYGKIRKKYTIVKCNQSLICIQSRYT